MDCKKEQNLKNCNCTYNPCNKKGICCDCIDYHRKMEQLPTCSSISLFLSLTLSAPFSSFSRNDPLISVVFLCISKKQA